MTDAIIENNLNEKYRPEIFEDILGQSHIVSLLKTQIETGNISNFYIFEGPAGTGKTTLAKIFAKALNCKNEDEIGPCNECKICVMIDQSYENPMEYCRAFMKISAFYYRTIKDFDDLFEKKGLGYSGNLPNHFYKKIVLFVDEAHCITEPAQNYLLEKFENNNYNPKLIVVFATTEPDKLLHPLRSRGVEFMFNPIPEDVIVEHLNEIIKKENIKFEGDSSDLYLEHIAIDANGSMRTAVKILGAVVERREGGNFVKAENIEKLITIIPIEELLEFIRLVKLMDKEGIINFVNKQDVFEKFINSLAIYIQANFKNDIDFYTKLSNLLILTLYENKITGVNPNIIFLKNLFINNSFTKQKVKRGEKQEKNIQILKEMLNEFINSDDTEFFLDYDNVKKQFLNSWSKDTDSSEYIKRVFLPTLNLLNEELNINISYFKEGCKKKGNKLEKICLRKK